MKRIIFSLFPALLLLFALSCQSTDPQHLEQEKLKDSVFVVHDEVMPLLGEIHRLSRQLKKYSAANPSLDETTKQRISNLILQLEKADDGMMNWMQEFKKPADLRSSMQHEEIMAYLKTEAEKVAVVKTDILGSIEAGKALVDSLGIK